MNYKNLNQERKKLKRKNLYDGCQTIIKKLHKHKIKEKIKIKEKPKN